MENSTRVVINVADCVIINNEVMLIWGHLRRQIAINLGRASGTVATPAVGALPYLFCL